MKKKGAYCRRMGLGVVMVLRRLMMLSLGGGGKLLLIAKAGPGNVPLALLPHLSDFGEIHGVIWHVMLTVPITKLGDRHP